MSSTQTLLNIHETRKIMKKYIYNIKMAQNRHICYYWQINDNKTVIIIIIRYSKSQEEDMGDLKMVQKETYGKSKHVKRKNYSDEINGRLGFAVENIIKLEATAVKPSKQRNNSKTKAQKTKQQN